MAGLSLRYVAHRAVGAARARADRRHPSDLPHRPSCRGDYLPENAFNDERTSDEDEQKDELVRTSAQQQSHNQAPKNGQKKLPIQPLVNRPPRPPLMSKATFWLRTRTAQTSERTHLAAAFAFVLFLLAADACWMPPAKSRARSSRQPGVRHASARPVLVLRARGVRCSPRRRHGVHHRSAGDRSAATASSGASRPFWCGCRCSCTAPGASGRSRSPQSDRRRRGRPRT